MNIIYESAPDAYYIIDYEGVFIDGNRATEELLGYDRAELIGKSFVDAGLLSTTDEIEKAVKILAENINGKSTGHDEFTLKRKDGTKITVELLSCPVKIGGEDRVLGIARDITERKRVEEALRESGEKYRSLVESTEDSIYLVDRNCAYQFMNKNHLSRFGGPVDEVVGREYGYFHSAEETKEFTKRVKEVFETGKSITSEYRSERDGGYFLRTLSPVKKPDGKITNVTVISKNITERKRAEEELRENEEKFRNILERIEDGYFEVDIAGNFTFFNNSLSKVLGYSRNEFMGMNNRQYTDEENAKKLYQTFNRVYSTGKADKSFDWEIIKKDGSKRYVESSVSLKKDPEGQPIGFRGIVRDVTERKRTEEALRESEAFKNTIIESSPDCIKLLDLEGNLTYMSKGGQEKFKIKDIKVYLNKSWIDFWQGTDNINARMAVDTAVKGATGKFRGYSPTETGIPRWWDVIITPLRGSNGEVEQLLAVSRDITEQKQMEEELLRAQKLESVGLLAGGIAHDFNNILTTIIGNVSLAKNQVTPEDDIFDLLNEAEMASTRAQTLTKQLLTFAKGGAPLKETASIKHILKESSSFVLRGSKSGCEFSMAENLWPAEVDVGQVSQVINNIVINANQAMPEGGTIQIAAENVNSAHP